MGKKRLSRRDFGKTLIVSGTALQVGSAFADAAVPSPIATETGNAIAAKDYLRDVLGASLPPDTIFLLSAIESATMEDGDVILTATLMKYTAGLKSGMVAGRGFVRLRLLGDDVVRVLISRNKQAFSDESPMLELDPTLQRKPAQLVSEAGKWIIAADGKPRATAGQGSLSLEFLPDGHVSARLQAIDYCLKEKGQWDALAAAFLVRGDGTVVSTVSLELRPGEHFCGTGERFTHIDLFGQQIDLLNIDAQGVNNARAYKNIPFLMSSRPYGLFVHSSAKMRIDIGRQSTRSLQWLAEDEPLDLFLIGGGSPERILWNYRRVTGFPKMPPFWSFGAWMSRYSYRSAEQMYGVADRLRKEKYPFDVLHLDPGWLKSDFECDWMFDKSRFPDPAGFFRHLREQGFRVSLWQYPYVTRDLPLAKMALEKGYVGRPTDPATDVGLGYTIDFSNPEAVFWYEGMLEQVLEMGASLIKADMGEAVDEKATYKNINGAKLHNLYALLYQRAVWEATWKVKKENIGWARSGWAGSQRYPIHWGGDSHCSYDGLAGDICGGLHLGLSGFAFWSHDIAGFLGVPDVLNDKPAEDLYVRWAQVGTLTSHMRFHGTTPREPWEYPSVCDIVREWLRLRYALIPYLFAEAQACCQTGMPMFRSLVIEWFADPAVWSISDQYMLGSAFLVCPILNSAGVRDVYLPEGEWVDFWSGQILTGPMHLKSVKSPSSRLPLYVRFKAAIEFAEPVQCTDQFAGSRKFSIVFNEHYEGFDKSQLKALINI
jgi:alpha-D-xyloside xylohydrolase